MNEITHISEFVSSLRLKMHVLTHRSTMKVVKSVTFADWLFAQATVRNDCRLFSQKFWCNLNYFKNHRSITVLKIKIDLDMSILI